MYDSKHLIHSATVAEVAVSQPAALSVFKKYNIDFCCGGNRSLEEACARVGADVKKVQEEIASASLTEADGRRFDKWTSSLLVDYIVQNHHAYVREASDELVNLLDKVCDAHGTEHHELIQIRDIFLDLKEELSSHMMKEEVVLFPALKRLEAQNADDNPLAMTIQQPLMAMEHEHDRAGELVKAIRFLSHDYQAPEFACPTYKITFKKLREFENDLMVHVHLENNILFDRVRK